MNVLPDGSAFFVGTVGPREPGLLNFLKYSRCGRARRYLFVWRMFWDAMRLSRQPGMGPAMSPFRALRWAITCR